jgi:hypothetical protein
MDTVECRASDSYPGTPIALMWEGVRREIDLILDRWRNPDGLGFRVRTTDSLTFELFYDINADAWRVTLS